MSPLALGSLITAIAFTATRIILVTAELAAGHTLIPLQVGGCIIIGACVSWAGFFTAHCRDTLAQKITRHSTSLATGVHDYLDTAIDERLNRISTELHLANRTRTTDHTSPYDTPPPRRPHLVP